MKCEGLYADIEFVNVPNGRYENIKDGFVLESLMNTYDNYKLSYVQNPTLDKRFRSYNEHHRLQVVQIYFSTATYDKIVNDVSVTLGDQISAIGGTMGLFAGFSILSVVEILYFLLKFLLTLIMKAKMKS